jgi:uncharacterized protein (TIGR03435 family)
MGRVLVMAGVDEVWRCRYCSLACVRKVLVICGLVMSGVHVPAQAGTGAELQFDVVSIKLDRSGEQRGIISIPPDGDSVIVTNAPMYRIVGFAFNFQRNDLVLGGPEWTRTERWDIEAKVAPGELKAFHALTFTQQKAMLRSVLVERCRMQAHVVKKEVPVYALVVAKGGRKLHEVQPVPGASGEVAKVWDLTRTRGEIHGRAVPMEALMYALSDASIDRQVVDRTGLKGLYDFDLLWTPDDEAGAELKAGGADTGATGS